MVAPAAYIDQVSDLEADSEYGVIRHLMRRCRVVNLPTTNYTVLMVALGVAGIPDVGTLASFAPNLVLTKRSMKLVDEDPATVDVDLTYDHVLNEGQSLDSPPYGVVLGKAQSSVSQQTSNVDANGNLIKLFYDYPADDPQYKGQRKYQGGEFQFMQAQGTRRYRGVRQTNYPWLLERTITGAVNGVSWAGGAVGTWLCTAANWEPCDVGNPLRFFFEFEFQYNPDGWNPTVVFHDDRTNAPPPLTPLGTALIAGVGFLTVDKYPKVNFEEVIGQRVQGG